MVGAGLGPRRPLAGLAPQRPKRFARSLRLSCSDIPSAAAPTGPALGSSSRGLLMLASALAPAAPTAEPTEASKRSLRRRRRSASSSSATTAAGTAAAGRSGALPIGRLSAMSLPLPKVTVGATSAVVGPPRPDVTLATRPAPMSTAATARPEPTGVCCEAEAAAGAAPAPAVGPCTGRPNRSALRRRRSALSTSSATAAFAGTGAPTGIGALTGTGTCCLDGSDSVGAAPAAAAACTCSFWPGPVPKRRARLLRFSASSGVIAAPTGVLVAKSSSSTRCSTTGFGTTSPELLAGQPSSCATTQRQVRLMRADFTCLSGGTRCR
mmetsp:Transcript_126139/g.351500  ORF Transcript_126139/g.351500 Transcript_126139/m.351500 type:complete len:324 (-) Transcript_126139:638-1609(-)